MPNYADLHAVADRIRAATASLTREEDAAAVRAYLAELEDEARKRAGESFLLAEPPLRANRAARSGSSRR